MNQRQQITVSKDHPFYDCFGWVELGSYEVREPNGDIQFWAWSRHYNGSDELVKSTNEPSLRLVMPTEPPRKGLLARLFGK